MKLARGGCVKVVVRQLDLDCDRLDDGVIYVSHQHLG